MNFFIFYNYLCLLIRQHKIGKFNAKPAMKYKTNMFHVHLKILALGYHIIRQFVFEIHEQ